MYVSKEEVELALQLLNEGNSIRSTMRITGVDGNTITKALLLAGERCEKIMGKLIVNVPVKDVECGEIWGFVNDGFAPYVNAIKDTLGDRVCLAQLIKVYRSSQDGEARYSPAEIAFTEVVPVIGQPDPKRICTSIVERQNLTIRMQMRRLTRLTNAFSKKWDNLWAAYCLHFGYYNFCRIHRSIRVTPAMEAGITDHVWYLSEFFA